uniref:Putative secreted protein n=1 Tax=Anopheles darlingi TaxID=43151 RepID=A0A2M4D2F0_ANODA
MSGSRLPVGVYRLVAVPGKRTPLLLLAAPLSSGSSSVRDGKRIRVVAPASCCSCCCCSRRFSATISLILRNCSMYRSWLSGTVGIGLISKGRWPVVEVEALVLPSSSVVVDGATLVVEG